MAQSSERVYTGPLPQGKQATIFSRTETVAGSASCELTLDADTLLASLYVTSITAGSLSVVVETLTDNDKALVIIEFPTLTAPTTELVLQKAAAAMARVRFTATWTGAVTFDVRARGLGLGETNTKLVGASSAVASQKDIDDSAPQVLIPLSLAQRSGLVIRNWSAAGTLYVGFTAPEANPATGYPIAPKEQIGMDLATGATLYAIADAGTIDVRIVEAGG